MQHDNGRQQEQVGHYANAFVFYDVKNIFSNKRRRNENATEIFFKPFLCFVFNLIFGVFKANLSVSGLFGISYDGSKNELILRKFTPGSDFEIFFQNISRSDRVKYAIPMLLNVSGFAHIQTTDFQCPSP